MSAEEVTVIMWQLLQALKFLHLNNVWHRWEDLRAAFSFSRILHLSLPPARLLNTSCGCAGTSSPPILW